MKILVTGADSQLARCIKDDMQSALPEDTWVFKTRKGLDITNEESILKCFAEELPDVVVNCAAYTDVEKAEDEFYQANLVNCIGVHYLSEVCQRTSTFLIHISTDYVYKQIDDLAFAQDDWHNRISKRMLEAYAFAEDAELEPLNKYGITKYLGEKILMQNNGSMIIRTSWLYSEYGKNFMKAIIKKIDANEDISVVSDQIGRPTNAHDLAKFITGIVSKRSFSIDSKCTVVNFQDGGDPCSWLEFAIEISKAWNGIPYPMKAVRSSEYKTKATRPSYSVMDLRKARSMQADVPDWKESLMKLIEDSRVKIAMHLTYIGR